MASDHPLSALDAAQAAFNAASAGTSQASQPWSPELVKFLSVGVLSFTFAALVLCTVLLWRSKAAAAQVLRIFGVLVILGMSALLLVVGFSNEQLTPIVGLFGAVAGYLLGKDSAVDGGAKRGSVDADGTKADSAHTGGTRI